VRAQGSACGATILVEGLFDALALATCGWSSTATIGRWAAWLPRVCAGHVVWLAFDNNRYGERAVREYTERLTDAETRRLIPPPPSQDWNAALQSRGRAAVARWMAQELE
jgi:DNA primase